MTDSSDPVVVHVASGETDAQLVRGFLESRGIDCVFRGEALRHTHGFTLDGLGEVRIEVAADRADEARELLARVERGELELPGDPDPDAGDPGDAGDPVDA